MLLFGKKVDKDKSDVIIARYSSVKLITLLF